jgi:hypothetical protein
MYLEKINLRRGERTEWQNFPQPENCLRTPELFYSSTIKGDKKFSEYVNVNVSVSFPHSFY